MVLILSVNQSSKLKDLEERFFIVDGKFTIWYSKDESIYRMEFFWSKSIGVEQIKNSEAKAVVYGDGTEVASFDLLQRNLDFHTDEDGETLFFDEEIEFEEGNYNDIELKIYIVDNLGIQHEFSDSTFVKE